MVEYSTPGIGNMRVLKSCFFFVETPTGEIMSAPGDGGWEVV